jgi:hypothetical protein
MLFIFIFCILYCFRKNFILIAVSLFFLAQTNVFGFLIAVSISFFLFITTLIKERDQLFKNKLIYLTGAIIIISGFILSYLQMKPPADIGVHTTWLTKWDQGLFGGQIALIWRSYVPIPENKIIFWNTNFLTNIYQEYKYSVLILLLFFLVFIKKPKILLLYLLSTIALGAFFYTRVQGLTRHWGNLYLALILCLWLYKDWLNQAKTSQYLKGVTGIIIIALFVAQAYAGIYAYIKDYKYPFSASKAAAEYIKSNHLDNLEIVGDSDYATSAVAGYFDHDFYYPRSQKYGNFVIWNNKRNDNISSEDILASAEMIANKSGKNVLIITNRDIIGNDPKNENGFQISKIKQFKENIVGDEGYYLYLVKKD